jgi:hypothetical protein
VEVFNFNFQSRVDVSRAAPSPKPKYRGHFPPLREDEKKENRFPSSFPNQIIPRPRALPSLSPSPARAGPPPPPPPPPRRCQVISRSPIPAASDFVFFSMGVSRHSGALRKRDFFLAGYGGTQGTAQAGISSRFRGRERRGRAVSCLGWGCRV